MDRATPEEIVDRVVNAISVANLENDIPVGPMQIMAQGRRGWVVDSRHLAICIVRDNYGFPLQTIARLFNKRNHATIHHALRSMDAKLQVDRRLSKVYIRTLEILSLHRHRAVHLKPGYDPNAKSIQLSSAQYIRKLRELGIKTTPKRERKIP